MRIVASISFMLLAGCAASSEFVFPDEHYRIGEETGQEVLVWQCIDGERRAAIQNIEDGSRSGTVSLVTGECGRPTAEEQELLAGAPQVWQRIWLVFPYGSLPDIANLAVLGGDGSGTEVYVWECHLNQRIVATRSSAVTSATRSMPIFMTGPCGDRLPEERELYADAIEVKALATNRWAGP